MYILQDRALAEVELFGAEIPADSWDGMDETEYFEKIFQVKKEMRVHRFG